MHICQGALPHASDDDSLSATLAAGRSAGWDTPRLSQNKLHCTCIWRMRPDHQAAPPCSWTRLDTRKQAEKRSDANARPEPNVLLQAIVAGAVAYAVFGMPILLAFTLGFILKAVGPAIVIQLMFDLQRKGRGVDKGAPLMYAQML